MSNTIGKLSAILTGNTEGFTSAFDKAGKSLNKFRYDAEKAGSSTDGFFKNLKGITGEESSLGNLAKVLAGGGAIAAVGILSQKLSSLTETMAQGVVQIRTGQKSIGDLTAEMLAQIPIAGSLGKSLADLAIAFTDKGKLAEEMKRTGHYAEMMRKITLGINNEWDQAANTLEGIKATIGAMDISLMGEGRAKQEATALAEYQAKLNSIKASEEQYKKLHSGLGDPSFMEASIRAMEVYQQKLDAISAKFNAGGGLFGQIGMQINAFTKGITDTANNLTDISKIIADLTFDATTAGLDPLEKRIADVTRQMQALGATQEQIRQATDAITASANAAAAATPKGNTSPQLAVAGSQDAAQLIIAQQQKADARDKNDNKALVKSNVNQERILASIDRGIANIVTPVIVRI